jgi:alpha-beta hydrolase superfamily lysophospholipase
MTTQQRSLVREEATLKNRAGMNLFERRWLPLDAPRAVVILVHGYAEHTGRYDHVGAWLAERGYAVRGFDLRGHGLSDGARALVRSFNEFLEDLREYLPRVRGEHPGTPVVVLGHSMGGAIAALWLAVDQPALTGALLSGPVAATNSSSSPLGNVLSVVARFWPALPVTTLDAGAISRDTDVVKRYEGDPLVYRGRIKAGLAAAMVRAAQRTDRDAERIILPLLLMHGSQDRLTPPDGTRRLHQRVGSRDRTFKLYDGLYHEILNEPERDQVLEDINSWLTART